MKFLPDSAVLGILGHIKNATRKKRGSAVGLSMVRDRHAYYYPRRTTQELLALAGHARKANKAGKQKKAGKECKVLLVAKGATESRDKVKTEAKFIRRRIAVALIALALIAWAFDATTPEQCKVPVEQMNSFCKDLLYP